LKIALDEWRGARSVSTPAIARLEGEGGGGTGRCGNNCGSKRLARDAARRRTTRWLRRDRRDYVVHEHLEPAVLIGAGLLAKKAVEKASSASRG